MSGLLQGRLSGLIWVGLGALAALGQAPWSLWYLALAALALMFWRVSQSEKRMGFGAGWSVGFGYFLVALFWIVEPFQIDAARHGWMAPFALGFMAGGLALFWGLAFAVVRRFFGGNLAALVLALGLAEYLRATVLSGFPWAMPAYIWSGFWPAQLVAYIGPHGLNALTLIIAALPGMWRDWRGFAASFALLALAFGAGGLRLSDDVVKNTGPRLRIVQPNIPQEIKWDPARGEEFFQKHLALSRGDPVDLVIWPESAVQWWLGQDPIREAMISAAANAPVVLGGRRFEGRRIFNTLALIGPGGVIQDQYDKRHLVPFGEYIPFGGLFSRFGINGLASEEGGGFSAGQEARLIGVEPLGNALPLICYEAIFPTLAASSPRADYLLQITNDAWFGTLAGPQQHFAQTRFRAIEQGLPLVRAANTGISAIIDAKGRVVRQLPLGVAGALEGYLPAAITPTVYSRTGDLPILGLLLIGITLLVLRRRRR